MMEVTVKKAPVCGHCGAQMVRYDLPPVTFADGLGWATTFLWVCANDECPVFRKGFEHTLGNYGHTTSLRSIVEPDSGRASVIPAFSLDESHFKKFVEFRKSVMKAAGDTAGEKREEKE